MSTVTTKSSSSRDVTHALASEPKKVALFLHSLALALLLLLGMPLMAVDRGHVSPDEGVVEIAARHLDEHGSWRAPYPLAEVDPAGHFVPLNRERYAEGEMLTYPSRPAYIHLNRLLYHQAGPWGPAGFGAIMVAATALLVSLTVRIVEPQAALPALWLCGIGTPLLFNAYVLQGHQVPALSAAGLGYLALSAYDANRRRQLISATIAFVLIAIACLVRRETVFLAIAVALWAGWRLLRYQERNAVAIAAGSAAGAGVGIALERVLMRNTFGTFEGVNVPVLTGSSGLIEGRIVATRESLLLPGTDAGSILSIVALAGLVVLVIGMAYFLARSEAVLLIAGLVVTSIVPALRVLSGFEGVAIVPGLLFAAPALVAGLVLIPSERMRSPAMQYLVVSSLVVSILVLATQYPTSWDWGGRFFLLTIPTLAALSAIGWRSVNERLAPLAARTLLGAGYASVLILAVVAVAVHRDNRVTSDDLVDEILAHADDGTVIASGPVWLPRFDADQLGDVGYVWAWVPKRDLETFVGMLDDHPTWDRVVATFGRGEGPPLDVANPGWETTEGPLPLPTINPPMELWVMERR